MSWRQYLLWVLTQLCEHIVVKARQEFHLLFVGASVSRQLLRAGDDEMFYSPLCSFVHFTKRYFLFLLRIHELLRICSDWVWVRCFGYAELSHDAEKGGMR